MYHDSVLSAGQLIIMAVVVVASLAAWLTAVLLAARQRPRDTSAAINPRPREEETGAAAARLHPEVKPAEPTEKAAALSGKTPAARHLEVR